MVWSCITPFLDDITIEKIKIANATYSSEMLLTCNPYQVEEKYGGKAPNLEVFWPPVFPSGPVSLYDCNEKSTIEDMKPECSIKQESFDEILNDPPELKAASSNEEEVIQESSRKKKRSHKSKEKRKHRKHKNKEIVVEEKIVIEDEAVEIEKIEKEVIAEELSSHQGISEAKSAECRPSEDLEDIENRIMIEGREEMPGYLDNKRSNSYCGMNFKEQCSLL